MQLHIFGQKRLSPEFEYLGHCKSWLKYRQLYLIINHSVLNVCKINYFKQKEVWTFFLFKEGNFSAKLNKSLSSRTNNRWVSHWIGQRTGWHDSQIQFQIRKIQKTSFKASMKIARFILSYVEYDLALRRIWIDHL